MWCALALWGGMDAFTALTVLGLGAFFPGLFSARMSPGKQYFPAFFSSVLGAGTVMLLLWVTPLGKVAPSLSEFDSLMTAKWVGGVVIGSFLVGNVIGEFGFLKSQGTSMGWLLSTTWLSMGTLFLSSILVASVLVNPETERAFRSAWMHSASLSDVLGHDRLVFASALSLVGMAFLSGVVTQTAAPRRMLTVSSLGAPIVLFVILTWFALSRGMFDVLWRPAMVAGGFAFAAAWLGAAFAAVGRRNSVL